MKKRILALALALTVSLTLVPMVGVTAIAEGGISNWWYGSNGKFVMPIDPPKPGSVPIYDRAGLERISGGTDYYLANDIDLSGEPWKPIGSWLSYRGVGTAFGEEYFGTFDGQGHTIKGLTITSDSLLLMIRETYVGTSFSDDDRKTLFLGLFAQANAVKNLAVEDININIQGTQYATDDTETLQTVNATIEYCGGIVGAITYNYKNDSIIANCYTSGNISFSYPFYPYSVGGIIGESSYLTSNIEHLTNNVNVDGGRVVGGIVAITGFSGSSSHISIAIRDCTNNGSVKGNDTYLNYGHGGGIVGATYNDGLETYILDCVNNGQISATMSGGIIGFAQSGKINIANCTNYGINNGGSASGGIIGGIINASIVMSESSNFGIIQGGDGYTSFAYGHGGLVGGTGNGTVVNNLNIRFCKNEGAVGGWQSGGLVGHINHICEIEESYNLGTVGAQEQSIALAGGLVGSSSKYVKITNTYNNAAIHANNSSISGGLVARSIGECIIKGCYVSGQITSSRRLPITAGILGFIGATDSNGTSAEVTIENCAILSNEIYAYNELDPYKAFNAIIGPFDFQSIQTEQTAAQERTVSLQNNIAIENINGFQLIDDTGDGFGGARISSVEAIKQGTYEELGWDFENIWKMPKNGDYPILKWQNVSDDNAAFKILSVQSPANATIRGKVITATVGRSITEVPIIITATDGATWKLYSDSELQNEHSDKVVKLNPINPGVNTWYIKLSALDIGEAVYSLEITRLGASDLVNKEIDFDAQGKRLTVNVNWGNSLFYEPATSNIFNYDLALVSAALSSAAYDGAQQKEYYIREAFNDLEIENCVVRYQEGQTDNFRHAVGLKRIRDANGDTYNLIVLVLRGTDSYEDIMADFSIGNTGLHEGFRSFAQVAKSTLDWYLEEYYGLEMNEQVNKYLVVGHSLGGAAANILAHDLSREVSADKVYCYTIGTPNTIRKEYLPSAIDKNIYNIVNATDAFTGYPADWRKFGTSYVLPSAHKVCGIRFMFSSFLSGKVGSYANERIVGIADAIAIRLGYSRAGNNTLDILLDRISSATLIETIKSTDSAMYYDFISWIKSDPEFGRFFDEYKIIMNAIDDNAAMESLFADGGSVLHTPTHNCGVYLSWIKARTMLYTETDGSGRYVRAKCPVDVIVRNGENEIVARIINNEVDLSVLNAGIVPYVDGEAKCFYFTNDDNYAFTIASTDSGTMTYTVEDINILSGEMVETKEFANVALYDGKQMISNASGGLDIADIQLFVQNDAGESIAEIGIGGGETPAQHTVTFDGNGGAPSETSRSVAYGAAVGTLPSATRDQHTFNGWFTAAIGGTKISSSTVITDAVTFYAQWTKTNSGSGDMSGGGGGGNPSSSDSTSASTPPDCESSEASGAGGVSEAPSADNIPDIADELPFADVPKSAWFYSDVAWAYGRNLMVGTSATEFSPNVPLTRGMLVTILYRLANEPAASGGDGFSDVPGGVWYSDAIAWAKANNIVNGIGGNLFAPDNSVTREQAAAILRNYASYVDFAPQGDWAATLDFADADQIAEWALDGAMYCYTNGIITGKPGKLFDPQGQATRAEIAAILRRYAGMGN